MRASPSLNTSNKSPQQHQTIIIICLLMHVLVLINNLSISFGSWVGIKFEKQRSFFAILVCLAFPTSHCPAAADPACTLAEIDNKWRPTNGETFQELPKNLPLFSSGTDCFMIYKETTGSILTWTLKTKFQHLLHLNILFFLIVLIIIVMAVGDDTFDAKSAELNFPEWNSHRPCPPIQPHLVIITNHNHHHHHHGVYCQP